MEHCKDKLPTPAGLWFFVLLYPTFITYINSRYRLFWPTQQSILCPLGRWDFFPPSTKTDVNRDVASLHWHKTTTNFTYYCISAWMELAGRQVKTPIWFRTSGRVREEWVLLCPACSDNISVLLSKALNLQDPAALDTHIKTLHDYPIIELEANLRMYDCLWVCLALKKSYCKP